MCDGSKFDSTNFVLNWTLVKNQIKHQLQRVKTRHLIQDYLIIGEPSLVNSTDNNKHVVDDVFEWCSA